MFPPKFRSTTCKSASSGAYVMVFQRPDEEPGLDICFFEGNRSIDEAKHEVELLERGIAIAEAWKTQKP